jgi:DtxR family transcriptional regulator, manganese transport regulator
MATNRYQRTRDDHSREVAEDYVELIDAVIQERGKARTVDLATRLGISHVTVTKTLQRLIREGLVTSEPYRDIELTKQGKTMAIAAKTRHELVHAFLLSIGVPADVAETDTEGIEHHVSEETLQAMRRHLETP